MNALIFLAISVCLRPAVEVCCISLKFPSTLWIDSVQNPREAAGGLLVSSKIIPPGFDEVLNSYSKTTLVDDSQFRISELPETAFFEWPEYTLFGINLVFCSCKKFHVGSRTFSYLKYPVPEDLLWPGSRKILYLTTPTQWSHSVEWASLWKNETECCGCGVAIISSYVGKSFTRSGLVSDGWYDAYLTSTPTSIIPDDNAKYTGRSSILIRPVLINETETTLSPLQSSSQMSSTVIGKLIHYTLIEHAEHAGNSPSCKITHNDFVLKKNEWLTVWGVARSIKDLLTLKKPIKRRATALITTHYREEEEEEEEEEFSNRKPGKHSSMFIRFYDVSDWRLEPITRSSSTSRFDFFSHTNTLFCLAVWVGAKPSFSASHPLSGPSQKYKFVIWKNWKVAASAPIFITSTSEIKTNWATKVRDIVFKSSPELPIIVADAIKKKLGQAQTRCSHFLLYRYRLFLNADDNYFFNVLLLL